ncbi:ArsR/SmtB family transcription factor [Paenibacillus pasadenensis]|uniref:Transcriptional regulator, ArsR family n=1 Tax=Paenibacillus pasadenensis TaxID=217090 RepID=A0A2N5N645_9BACL|nr:MULTISPECIES: helix-turn-helix domain-containing protein [Paenibacillus]PLT45821.1 Transcriptional regulator, ArsR family [Paenibacillus pasadenensis]QGG56253.1 helix-turn-helix domain-containing protein [Paenibacillus sp. B01]
MEQDLSLDLTEASLPVYEALASPVRLRILRLLQDKPMNVKELAAACSLSSAIMTMHVRKLAEAGLLRYELVPGKSGVQKICQPAARSLQVRFADDLPPVRRKSHRIELPVGHYSDFRIEPTCGLATTESVIGSFDDPRYFWEPGRISAAILWFGGKGFVEYKAPNYLLSSQRPLELTLTLEVASEAPSTNNHFPSDITFTLNGVKLCTWTSPGDYGDRPGKFTPEWWSPFTNQYGLLKQLRVTGDGTFMDGLKLSEVRLQDIELRRREWTLRLSVEEDAVHRGGMTLFGKGFGNYDENMALEVVYEDGEPSAP